jgi:alpha-amylase
MKKLLLSLITVLTSLPMLAQGWPENYEGVMLQGFYWDSYTQSQWVKLERQADELSQYFTLVWLPQSGNCGGTSMGYDDLYWFPGHYDSSFGSESELRSLISTFKSKGIGTIADVVINHRKNVSNWVDFPRETYKGVTYELKSTDICANDDNGATKTWATKNGYSLSSNNDTGEGWGGMRDLDHKSENVQKNVKAYLHMLLEDMGYAGFRYDMVKGYKGSFTKLYNEDSRPAFSVGECWDGTNTIRNWIDSTGRTSAAFDFQFRYTVRNAANNSNWQYLTQKNDNNWPLVSNSYSSGEYRQWAVTFVENHDTEKRSDSAQDPLKKDTLAANAYMLAMPGTPCVFLTHWIDCKRYIKAMIDVRRAAGIQNTGSYEALKSSTKCSAFSSTGSKAKLLVVVGDISQYTPVSSWVKVLEGYHYAYYLDNAANTAWIDLPNGQYEGKQQATLTAVSADAGARIVYTTDGTEPTASSTAVASGTKIDIEGDMTLKAGLLIGSTVTGIVTRTYTAPSADRRPITVYVNTDNVGWTAVNFWTWGGDDSHSPANRNWPGDKVSTTTTINGKQWFSKQYTINGDDDFVNFVFSTGTGSPQTVDINNVSTDKYYEISTTKNGSKYEVNDVTSQYTGIRPIEVTQTDNTSAIYTLDGRRVQHPRKGLYIRNGKKVIVK